MTLVSNSACAWLMLVSSMAPTKLTPALNPFLVHCDERVLLTSPGPAGRNHCRVWLGSHSEPGGNNPLTELEVRP